MIGILKLYSARRKLELKGINLDVSKLDKSEYSDRKKMSKIYTREVLKILNDFSILCNVCTNLLVFRKFLILDYL